MTHKQSIGKRITSVFLCLAILFGMIPLAAFAASATAADTNKVADPATIDDWKEVFFPDGVISTENAGGVWMDKSVFVDAGAFSGTGITANSPDSFLVTLSAIASTMSVTGMSSVPTDSILVLDVSGSMNDNSGNNDVAEELVEAANSSIAALLGSNKYNRVGVVLYSGPTTVGGAASANDSVLILPLDRYTTGTDGQYLNYIVTGNRETTETVRLDADVVIEGTGNAPTMTSKTIEGGTYIQKGVILAMDQFIAQSNSVVVDDPAMGTLQRKPVLVLMSDGAPTVGSTNFTAPASINLGDGSSTSAALSFVSQLSSAYAKAKIEEKYGTDALFYTLGLGVDNDPIAIGVLDPDHANASTALSDFWTQYNAIDTTDNSTSNDYVTVQSGGRGTRARTVSKADIALEQNYVDRYFSAETDNLIDVFGNIVSTIQLQSSYFPTLISESEDLSGYVSFIDRIGQHMEVTDIKGILIDNTLFSGADLASNFVAGGGALGTYEDPTALGLEMVAAVRARLGLDSDETARTLIGLAYENGQIRYTDKNNYSNYIGWYANAAGEFLGFYHEGVTVLPDATGNTDTDPAFIIRSYGYLGAVDEGHGVTESDMMYATVQMRKNIATGEELVIFAVPAALIPVVIYNVTLDENGDLDDLTVGGAEHPICLVYEVALDEDINAFNVKEKVSSEYLADEHNVNADGSVNFYTNQWEHQNTTGYGTINTYSYFNPAKQNDRYYYLEDASVYADASGTLYTGSEQPSGEKYRACTVYKNNGGLRTETVYRRLSDAAMATAQQKEDGTWYISKGNVHVNTDGYVRDKTENLTGTLTESNIPFVDTHNHTVDDDGYEFYVGATLGNNGRLTVTPETGIKLTKSMAADAAAPADSFTFTLTNTTNAADNTEYSAWLIKADGTEVDTVVKFTDGVATVELDPNDVLYIGSMTANDTFRIEENETAAYVAETTGLSAAGTVTVSANTILPVSFVNADRGTGNLTVAKEVEHDFGVDYQIPADKVFTMQVTLSGIGTANAVFAAEHTNGQYTEITTDANGQFAVTLKHDEQFEVFGLPAGTTATVVETAYGMGFTPAYWDNGQPGDGTVTVVKNSTVSVIVVNDYAATEVYPVNITVSGNKTLNGRNWQEGDSFTFKLEKLISDSTWQQLGDTVETYYGKSSFQFTDAFKNERYTAPGTYYYRIVEIEPATPIGGITYDKTVHSFSVVVGDVNMDGELEITDVKTDRPDTTEVTATNSGWNVFARFTNTYSTTGSATVTIDVNKVIENIGGSEKTLAGYTFGLFDPATGAQIGDALTTTERGFARFALTYGPSDGGNTYTYILKEIAPNPIPAGWTYSKQETAVTVKVFDGGDGTLSAVIFTGTEQPENADTSIAATFTNTYDPTDAELDINFVDKRIIGREFKADDDFTFQISETNVPEGRTPHKTLTGTLGSDTDNDGVADVIFSEPLRFTEVGTYFFNIVEIGADGKGIVTDKTIYRIAVTVIDVNGELAASYVLVNAAGNTITFRNTYTTTPAEHTIVGTKNLCGRTLINDEFTFVLTELAVDGAAIQNPRTWTTKNLSAGENNIVFPTISYDRAGTYTYSAEEVIPDGGSAYGIKYDTAQYQVTVVVKDNGEGALIIDSETVTLFNHTPASSLTFLNYYEAKGTSARFSGEKQLTGKVNHALQGGEFEFELYNSDANWERSSWKETVENGAGGSFAFTEIDFDTDEDQYFIVVEKNGGNTIDGITYDDTVYRVWVEVTDDLKGQLHATVHIYDGVGIPQNKILFANVYEITGGANVTLSGEKTIDGREFKENDSFTFELYEADENFNASETPKISADMDSTTHKYQITLDYTAADAGKTFYYVLKEKNAGQTIGGIVYSEAVYQIKVVVEDDDKGGIKTTVTVENATTSTLDFVNDYHPAAASVTINGTKELAGRDLLEGEFKFLMVEADETFTVLEGTPPMAALNGADGSFSFDALSFTEAGTYCFVVMEDSTVEAERVIFDTAVYYVTVEVADDENGKLVASDPVIVKKDSAGSVQAIRFTNVYVPETGETADEPQAGDNSNLAMWAAMMFISGGAAITLCVCDKKRRDMVNH